MTADVTADTAEPDQIEPGKMLPAPAGAGDDPKSWRGIAAEHVDDVSAPLAALLRRRSRVLLGSLLRPHRRGVTLTAVLIVLSSLCALAGPWLIGVAIDNGLPPMLKGNAGPLLWIAVAFAVTVVVQAFASQAFVTMTGRIGQAVVLDLRRRLFAHMLRLSVSFHESYTSGRVISRQTSDVEAISSLFDEGLDSLIMAVLTLLLVGTGMLLLDWPLGLVVLSGFIPLVWLSAWFRRESTVAYRRIRDANALVIVHFVETFGGLRAVQAFRREKRNEEIFDALSEDYAAASKRSSQLSAVFAPGIAMVGNVITGIVLCYGGFRVLDGDIQVGVLASFLLYLQRFFDPLQEVSQFYNSFQGAASALEKLSGVLEEEPSVAAPALPAELPVAASGRRVSFESVRFGYRQAVVLPDFSLDIPAGQTVALVGETGAGKTTVARLLARFYDPNAGRVLLDGVDLRELPDDVLRREIVLITQESFLFEGSVAENIRLGRPAATVARHPVGTARPVGLAHGARRADRADHRAPAVHGGDRRPGACAARGPGDRGRLPRRADERHRGVRRPARPLGRQPRLTGVPRAPIVKHVLDYWRTAANTQACA
jgi:ATP-binding cassette subfamily B protein